MHLAIVPKGEIYSVIVTIALHKSCRRRSKTAIKNSLPK